MALGTEGVEVLQEPYAEGRLTGPADPAYNAREWRLKFETVNQREVFTPADVTTIEVEGVHPSLIYTRTGRTSRHSDAFA